MKLRSFVSLHESGMTSSIILSLSLRAKLINRTEIESYDARCRQQELRLAACES